MKKNTGLFAVAVAVILVAASCSKSQAPVSQRKVDICVTGDFDELGTRASVENVFRMTWEENDVVYVFGKASGTDVISCLGQLKAAIVPDTDKRLADLSGTITEPSQNTKLTLVYSPLLDAAPSLTSNSLSIDLASQNGGAGNVTFVTYATVDYQNERTSTYRTAFNFATSILRVNVTGLNPGGELINASLGEIESKCVIRMNEGGVSEVSGEAPGIINRTFSGASSSAKGTTSFYLALPNITANSQRKLTISQADDYAYECDGFAAGTSPCGKMLNSTGAVTPAIVDLSGNGCANCYIVRRAGKYKFRADLKGNSQNTVGDLKAAKVLWESFGTLDAIYSGDLVNNVSLKDGNYVYFTATEKKGNAVVAICDGSGNVLWSWHIWLTDCPETQTYADNGIEIMDRNLGATSTGKDATSLGLIYQWGRKDPFIGGGNPSETTTPAACYPAPTISVTGPKDLDYAIKHPDQFISNTNAPSDWLSKEDNALWGSSKTMYDPCPRGYRVPDGGDNSVWAPLSIKGLSFKQGFEFQLHNGEYAWYPAAGWRGSSGGSLNYVGTDGYCWTCTNGGDRLSYYLSFNKDRFAQYTGNRARGHSVRCIKE